MQFTRKFSTVLFLSHSLSFSLGKSGFLNTAIYLLVLIFMFPLLLSQKDKSMGIFLRDWSLIVICSMYLPLNRDISMLILTNKEHCSASIKNIDNSPTLTHSALTLSFVLVAYLSLVITLCISRFEAYWFSKNIFYGIACEKQR